MRYFRCEAAAEWRLVMKIYDETSEICMNNTVVTLGKFNAIHLGHQKLIQYICEEKEKEGYDTVLFSFDTSRIRHQKLITTKKERIALCERFEIDNLVFYPVNQETMSMEPEDFITRILVEKLGVKVVVTGQDFHFGRNRRGNVEMLRQYGERYDFQLIISDSVMVDGKKVSSSAIKDYLSEGLLENANKMLGYQYFIMGTVSEGKHIGRTIGTKTINIVPDNSKLLPKKGVYKTKTYVDGKSYKSITNIGTNPTVKDDGHIIVETHIFDFERNIYDSGVKIEFEKFLREERKFSDLEALRRQISLDILQANL